jgi:hypothetical protein
MGRKIPQRKPEMPLYLGIPRDEARQKIAERIKRGEGLKSRTIENDQQFNDVQKAYWTWNEYNQEMLRQIFTTAKIVEEYNPPSYFFAIDSKPLQAKIGHLHEDIDFKIRTLTSITERLELIQVAPNRARSASQSEETLSKDKIFPVAGSRMDKAALLTKLKDLLSNKSVIEKNGPTSDLGQDWLTTVGVHLELVDKNLAYQFNHYKQFIVRPLSAATAGPLWIHMQGHLRTAIARLELEMPQPQSKVYGPGESYDVYRDLAEIMSKATKEAFIVDPYANEEVFTLYLEKIPGTVKTRLLTGTPSSALRAVKGKFGARPNIQVEARMSSEIHDRVIFIDGSECWVLGQSIKDAAIKKPTYMIPIPFGAVTDMSRLYETIWQKATAY